MYKRFEELDSLRGLAALSVVIMHIFQAMRYSPPLALKNTPLSIVWNGHGAVIMFFVLSGFVLSRSYNVYKQPTYMSFLVKRIFRIYLPYIIITFGYAVIASMFYNRIINDAALSKFWSLRDWLQEDLLRFDVLWDHILLIKNFSNGLLNPVVWTLIHEMRISLIFPILILLIFRINWALSLTIGILLSLISHIVHICNFEKSLGYYTGYFDSLHFILMFIVGSLISKNLEKIKNFFAKLSTINKLIFFIIGLICYTYSFVLAGLSKEEFLFADWLTTLGSSLLIITALCSHKLSEVLQWNILTFIGKISYSMYLIHVIVLVLIFNTFYMLPQPIALIISICAVCLVSYVVWALIETPCIILGKTISAAIDKKINKHITQLRGTLK